MQTFGQKLRELRESKSMNQDELATIMAVKPVTIGRWERGESVPDIPVVLKLSQYFNYSLLPHFDPGWQQAGDDKDVIRILSSIKKQLDRLEVGQKQIIDKLDE